ncbi:chaperonin 10-like protein [Aspergillus cavernicola]|uniref:Chaperonin 10-like protein n=1 Tax=Aspergillus cavernicola TaxID=176166 RepID=A0ABR4J337_9EURO
MTSEPKFHGWLGLNTDSATGKMVWAEYEPKPFEPTDIDMRITHCGVCGSDLHHLRSGWRPADYPLCVGHEIIGIVIRVGSAVPAIKIGDRVGVGAQSGACLNQVGDCEACAEEMEQYCPRHTITYDARYPDGSKANGGYADYWRGPGAFVFQIPDAIPSHAAASMLCGGITAFSPLLEHGAGPGKRVGVIGIGGIGHFGVLAAKALGCDEIIAISRSSAKKEDALKMGATGFIATDEDEDWARGNACSLDLILSTVSSANMPFEGYLNLLRLKGHFVQLGAPEEKTPPFSMFALLSRHRSMSGSLIGSRSQIKYMLDFFAEKEVMPWVVTVPMADANKAIVDFEKGRGRYRYVLVNEKHL